MIHIVNGAIAMAYCVAGLFFFRFHRQSHDRLFLIFGISFWALAVQRLLLTSPAWLEHSAWLYAIRLAAFLLILWAIIDKNRR